MTPRERAHALTERCESWTHPDPKHDGDKEDYACFCCIAAEFEAVTREVIQEECGQGSTRWEMREAAHARGRREALEEASRVPTDVTMEAFRLNFPVPQLTLARTISERISALAREEGE